MNTSQRKNDHIHYVLDDRVDNRRYSNEFDTIQLEYQSLPEIDFASVDTSIELHGKKLFAPIIIGSMTGGTEKAKVLNQRLAKAAEICQIGMALGSQRIQIENHSCENHFSVKLGAPNLPFLFANIGAVQLNYGVSNADLQYIVESVNADALFFHTNPLQETLQTEGNTNFSELIKKIEEIVTCFEVPIFLKDIGCGISESFARKIAHLSISGIEVAGLGGTSWAIIESLRSPESIESLGETFRFFGISTVQSLKNCQKHLKSKTIIASGGLRNGLDVAKAIILQADLAAFARPFLLAAEISTDAVVDRIQRIIRELKIAMFCLGISNINELKKMKIFNRGM